MTPNLERPLIESLNRWEGHHAGSYPLEKYLGGASMSAVYTTEYSGDRAPAVIKLMPADGSEGNRRLTLLSALSKQSHRGLIRLFDAGLCEIEGVSLLYVVMERADADLAQVLSERALTEVEARQMLEAVVGALSFLHEQGFVHGGIQPSNILAVGDEIKLSCDCVSYAGSPADDVRALGVTLVQALTQRKPNPRTPGSLAQPFFDIATLCLKPDPQSRWNIRQIAARLCEPEAPADKNPRRMAVYSMSIAITALAVISIVLMAGRDRSRTQIVAAPPAAAVIPASFPQQSEVAPPPPPAPAPPPPQRKAGAWFVVAATYAQQKDAENRAHWMARKWPEFKTEVYSPPLQNEKPYYLVVIGSNLTQNAAAQLKDRARAAGLALDAYITHF